MKKYMGLIMVVVGVVLLVLAVIFGFKKEEPATNSTPTPTPTPAPTSVPTSTPVSAEITLGDYV